LDSSDELQGLLGEIPIGESASDEAAMAVIMEHSEVTEDVEIDWRGATLADLGLTGVALWGLVAELERRLGRKIADDDAANWSTPEDVIRAVR
jgi:Phosphopantetheine attachment site.